MILAQLFATRQDDGYNDSINKYCFCIQSNKTFEFSWWDYSNDKSVICTAFGLIRYIATDPSTKIIGEF